MGAHPTQDWMARNMQHATKMAIALEEPGLHLPESVRIHVE